ncbi:MAG: osmotic-shock protein [Sphingomonadales bacterium RIFCSPHIGHO2_01_FULL_65_20]|jgi:YggT family protein|uniref:YggT family protein n=1 Tax=Sphingomonas ursincola TaxID=56361 RepID=A0A7V8RCZ3_9SPHN|nr:YggT family protein [Sphingomonas ursincola]MBA4778424.1 YggT family protein [Blastomonas sp.]OHC96921.1 MAG: osmotic-shock protein [Sphingomonadales bacterium RIFCSPHIGHO2_01_FULL_65_20]MBA1374192.1 YggT family protein [Sphingomonas ursincola]MBY0618730.1 YggT family protein [Sphingomonas ursincola]MCH2237585.1 YggT family protein [Blastomonas sp.]
MQIVLEILDIILQVVTWFIIIQIVLSWLIAFNVVSMQNDLVRQLVESLHRITEPLYRPVRKIMPDLGMIDLAPMVVILIVMILRNSIIPRLWEQFA